MLPRPTRPHVSRPENGERPESTRIVAAASVALGEFAHGGLGRRIRCRHAPSLIEAAFVPSVYPQVRYPKDLETIGLAVLAAGRVPGPPDPPYEVGVGYPLAFDVCGRIAAVWFAALDVYPEIAPGWWCLVEQFSLHEGAWRFAGGEYDNTTTPTPFERPTSVENDTLDWLDWGSNGGWAHWEDEPRERHSCFGIVPVRTARLTVTSVDGHQRGVRITPWNGAYVVVVPGPHSTLTGYDIDGNVLGTLSSQATPPPEPEIDESRRVRLPVDPDNPPMSEAILTWTWEPPDDR
jgi:hypothetical protein